MLSPVIWDACSLLNLLATDRAADILLRLERPCYVAGVVWRKEALYLRPLQPERQHELDRVDVNPLVEAGLLIQVDLFPDENTLYVEFAAQIDDGESQSLAIAVDRGGVLATDDRIARRVALALSPPVQVITTPEWLRYWAGGVPSLDVRDAVQRISKRARYTVRKSDDNFEWWQSHLQ